MQGLADGYFIIPYTIGNYLAGNKLDKVDTSHAGVPRAPRTQVANRTRTAARASRARAPSIPSIANWAS